MLYISELCEDYAIANEIDYEIDDVWTNIHGIHDNGPRDQGVWPLTLTAGEQSNLCVQCYLETQLVLTTSPFRPITMNFQ